MTKETFSKRRQIVEYPRSGGFLCTGIRGSSVKRREQLFKPVRFKETQLNGGGQDVIPGSAGVRMHLAQGDVRADFLLRGRPKKERTPHTSQTDPNEILDIAQEHGRQQQQQRH